MQPRDNILPIPTQGYLHNGSFYPTEAEAIEASLRDTAAFLMKEYSHNLADGLLALSTKLQRLLARRDELRAQEDMAAITDAVVIGRISDDD